MSLNSFSSSCSNRPTEGKWFSEHHGAKVRVILPRNPRLPPDTRGSEPVLRFLNVARLNTRPLLLLTGGKKQRRTDETPSINLLQAELCAWATVS